MVFYIIMAALCVELELIDLADISDHDFQIAGTRASNQVKTTDVMGAEHLVQTIEVTDEM